MMKSKFRSLQLAAASTLLMALMAGCGSSVNLNDAPVADRTGTAVDGSANAGSGAASGSARPVASVGADTQQLGEPPASVSRIIYFAYDSYLVQPEFAATLEAHAKFLKQDAKRRVILQGHTDERGGREYNLALGQKRAEAVRRSLNVLGVDDAQQEAVSYGEEKPAVTGSDESAFAKNRRVELSYR